MYVLKWDELWWGILTAVVTYLAQMLVDFDPGISLWVTENAVKPLLESMVVTG